MIHWWQLLLGLAWGLGAGRLIGRWSVNPPPLPQPGRVDHFIFAFFGGLIAWPIVALVQFFTGDTEYK